MNREFNASDRKAIREAEKSAKLVEQQRREVVRNICDTEPGRRYLWDRLSEAGIFIAVPAIDALHMAYAEGARAQGLALLNDITTFCPEQFITMIREANDRSNTAASIGKRSNGEGSGREFEGPDSAIDSAERDYNGDYDPIQGGGA